MFCILQGLDDWRLSQEQHGGVKRLAIMNTQLVKAFVLFCANNLQIVIRYHNSCVQENLLSGPFACAFTVSDVTALRGICSDHIKRYLEMALHAVAGEIEQEAEIAARASRDEVMMASTIQDMKFKFAAIMGGGRVHTPHSHLHAINTIKYLTTPCVTNILCSLLRFRTARN
jgi:hypothetical protein